MLLVKSNVLLLEITMCDSLELPQPSVFSQPWARNVPQSAKERVINPVDTDYGNVRKRKEKKQRRGFSKVRKV